MISINKIFLGIITIFVFTILIFNTFTNKNQNTFESVFYKNNENWEYWLEIKDNNIFFNTWSVESWLKINYLNPFDKILNYKWNINVSKNNIILSKWTYIIYISEINSKYNIIWEWFEIKNNWPTTIFIDSSWVRTTIFSLNSIIELNLINIENNKNINTVFLYPHNSIKIIPEQNKNIENADLLRITQRFPIDYFNESILINNEINPNLVNKIIWNKDEIETEIIKKMFSFILINVNIEEKYLWNFKSNKFGTLIWEKLIEKYNNLFLNDSKKTVYYKNLILRTIWDLIKSNKINEEKNNFLINSLDQLKNLNSNDYNELKNILYFYSNLVIDSNKIDINSKINFSKIYNKLENKDFNFNENFLLNLNDLYYMYDFKKENNIYNSLNNINDKIIEKKLSEAEKSYFIYYLKKVIISWFDNLSKNKTISLENILNIFDDYIQTSINYYSIDDNTRIRTWIEDYNEILKKLATKIEITYFEKNKDVNWLLILSKNNSISYEKIKILENNIESIFKYYDKYQNILWDKSKDELIKTEFSNNKIKYSQYILALKDYSSYIANYNEQNKQILFWDTATNSDNWEIIISIENAKKYLNTFDHLDISNTKISLRWFNYCENPNTKNDIDEIKDPYCYKIENLIIWSNLYLNMTLSPNDYNKISNFIINWDKNKNKWSYKLDNEKIVWNNNYKRNAWSLDIEKYDFKNFFLYIFNPPKIDTNNNDNNDLDNTEIIEESLIIKIFKRNKLLWNEWDFHILEWFIDIKYDDLIVKQINNDYDIYVKKWKLNYTSNNKKYIWDLSWKYIFIPDHSFSNLEILLYDDYEKVLFWWSKIKIMWNFNVKTIKNDLKIFFDSLSNLYNVLSPIENQLWINEFSIKYNYNENMFYIENEKISIKLKWIAIYSLIYNKKEYSPKPTSIYDFENNLKLIK